MKASNFIRGTLALGTVSQQEVSRRMGRGKSFIASYLSRDRTPSIELAAEIADAVNCDLFVISRDTGIEEIIEP